MRRAVRLFAILSGLLLLTTLATGATPSDPLPSILASLNGDEMKAWDMHIAGPDFKGRMTGEPELYQASAFVQDHWKQWGVQPVNEAGYQQEFPFTSSRTTGACTFTSLAFDGSEKTWEEVEDYQPFPYGGNQVVEGGVMFAGYGVSAPELGYDDYAGIDVTGKIVFIMRHVPGEDMKKYGDHATFTHKAQTAKDHGAIGMILITDLNHHSDFTPLDFPSANINVGPNFAAVFMHAKRACEWLEPQLGQPLAAIEAAIDDTGKPMSFPLMVRARLQVPTAYQPDKPSVNTVGWIQGSDPQLAKEIVVIGAHLDHIGYRGDRIYPGADDDGSGSVALLGVAQAFANAPVRPKRSIMFTHFSGEELGLLGSYYFVANQMLPPGTHIVAMLNMDMVGLGDGGVTTLTPPMAPCRKLTGLVEVQRKKYLADQLPLDHTHYGDAEPNSDEWPFADANIPALFFVSSGEHPDYHQIGDTPDKIVPECLAHSARLCLAVAWRIAEQGVPRRPLPVPVEPHQPSAGLADDR
ncbi:MAG: M28 family peptidase [bacterium]